MGFSLVELLMVILVLGLLAAIVVFAVGSTRGDAVQSLCRTRVKSVEQSAEAVRVRLESYPAGTVDAATAPNPLVAPEPGALLKGWPTDSRFVLRYVGEADGSSYAVDVYRADGVTPAGGCGSV